MTGSSHALIEFRLTGEEHRLEAQTELSLYRMAQESLNNAIHHAEASHILIELHYSTKEIELQISDNGEGFLVPENPGAFAKIGHFGLLGISERADLMGAKLTIHSSPGKGTIVSISKILVG
jgi:signal transduction histidine kinase